MPKRVRTPVPDVAEVMANGGDLSRSEAEALVLHLLPENEKRIPYRDLRDRVRKRIAAAIERGDIQEVRPGVVGLAAVAQFARTTWPGWNPENLPLPRALTLLAETGRFALTEQPATLRVSKGRPNTVPECHRIIGELEAEVARLSDFLRIEQERNADLEPDARKYRRNCATNKASAKGSRTRR